MSALDGQVPAHASRRAFLKSAGTATVAALTIGFEWAGTTRRAAALAAPPVGAPFAPNAFLRIGDDNSVTVIAKHVEMGQGAYTGIATIVAEELDADWTLVRVESAPADAKRYANLAFGTVQGTGGSSAMANSWNQLRDAGAKARAMLMTAAAGEWNVPVAELTADKGIVYHTGSKRQAAFGSLVRRAAALPVPDKVALKSPDNFKLIGRQVPRVDVPPKVNGTAQFTLDVVQPGLLVALLKRAPLFGGSVQSFDSTAALAVPGGRQGGPGSARRRGDRQEFLGGETRTRRARGPLGRLPCREAQLRRPHGGISAACRSTRPIRPPGRRPRCGDPRGRS